MRSLRSQNLSSIIVVIQNVPSKFVRMANWKQKGTIAATDVFKSILEGQAEIRVKSQNVFYNPVQEFNRDLSICVLSVFIRNFRTMKLVEKLKKGTVKALTIVEDLQPDDVMNDWKDTMGLKEEYDKEEFTILEALSATGLRSIRYAKEVEGVNKVIANDISAQAVETIKDNIIYNVVKDNVETSHDDACNLMYKHKERSKRFTAIDLDPYGCPSQFLDSAVQSVQDGGLLLVTATDMAVLAGNAPETCYSKYGAISLKTKCCHEMAIRILLQCIESHANRYGRYIVPLLSISVDFYVRVFVQVFSGAVHCKRTTSKLSMVYQCVGCDTITLQPLGGFKPNPTLQRPDQEKAYLPTVPPVGQYCEHCNSKHHLGGPIWSAPIHDATFVERVLVHVAESGGRYATTQRAIGVLTMIGEELPDVPLYSTLSRLCSAAHVENIPMLSMRSAILNAGYRVSYSHTSKLSIKTDAPALLLWDVIRAWEKEKPVKESKKESDPVTKHILSQEATYEVDFYKRLEANPPSRRDGRVRFQLNPAKFWGPGSRADINAITDRMSKARKNQNKYSINKKKRHYVKETCYPSKKKSTGDFIRITDTTLTECKPDCIESPHDIESKPDDIESEPDDIESKPNA